MIKVNKSLLAGVLALTSYNLIAAESYTVIDLGKLDDKSIFAYDINNSETVVGYSYTTITNGREKADIAYHGVSIQSGGVVTDLTAIVNDSADSSSIFGVNNNGTSVGFSWETITKSGASAANFERAIYTDVVTPEIKIVPPFVDGDVQNMRAVSINDNGVIVGFGKFNAPDDKDSAGNATDSLADRGFIFDTINETLTRVDPINYSGNYLHVALRDINASGRAVGWSQQLVDGFETPLIKSFYLDITAPANLVKLSISDDDRSSFPFSINDGGKVVGKRHVGDSVHSTAFVYDIATQALTDLPRLKEDYLPQGSRDIAIAYDINNQNQVVGTSLVDVVPDTYHAFLYEDGVMKNLNTMIDCKIDPAAESVGNPDWLLYEARAINDNGVIIGNGFLNSERKAFMLVPRSGAAKTCVEPVEEGDSGSGSLPLIGVLLLSIGSMFSRRKFS
ncbi:DUF3466 family protein [Aliikangiella sp. IMCC44359]|uniref:DUF3466 family protein n=1 Tax=Aliikangiella sp. IMCC44359 TaxID=3459125 RepID=UPI00403A8C12